MSDEGKSTGETGDPFSSEKPEASTFAKSVKTVTFSNGYKSDGKDPSFKMLDDSAINSTQVFTGLPEGTKQVVIRGNSAHHYLQNRFTHVSGHDVQQVDDYQYVTIKGDAKHLYLANMLRGVNGNDHIRVNKVRDIIVLGESSEQYLLKHEVTVPEEFEWKSFERGFSFTKIDLMGVGLDMHAVNVETYGANVAAGVDSAEGALFHQEIKLQHEHAPLFHTKEGVELDILLRGDALLDIGLGTPFR